MALTGILVAAAVIFDVSGPQPETNIELKNSVEIIGNNEESIEAVGSKEFPVGVLKVRNDFILPRRIEIDNINECLISSEGKRGRTLFQTRL